MFIKIANNAPLIFILSSFNCYHHHHNHHGHLCNSSEEGEAVWEQEGGNENLWEEQQEMEVTVCFLGWVRRKRVPL